MRIHLQRFGVAFCLFSVALCVLSACNGSDTAPAQVSTLPTPTPHITVTGTPSACPTVQPQIVQAFPAPASTAVATSIATIVFIQGPTVLSGSAAWGNLLLNGQVQGPIVPASSPLPSPIATLGPLQSYLSASVTTPLASHTFYQVGATFTNGCGQPDQLQFGSLTTQ